MKFKRIEIENFRCFYDKVVVEFSSGGLYFITGDNKFDDIGTNGVGKTSVWDAFSWCLFGKTSKGVRGPSLRARNQKGTTVVRVHFDKSIISRCMNPNSLAIIEGGKTRIVEQDELDKIFGFNFEVFHSFVIFGQGRPMFLSLTRSNRVNLLAECMGINNWQKLSDKSKLKRNECESAISNYSLELSSLKSVYDEIRSSIKEYKIDLLTSVRKRKGLLKEQEKESSDVRLEIRKNDKLLVKVRSSIKRWDEKLDSLRDKLSSLEGLKMDLGVACSKYEGRIEQAKRNLNRWYKHNECPTCGQDVTRIKGDRVDELKLLEVDNSRKILKYQSKIDEVDKRISKLDSLVKSIGPKVGLLTSKEQWLLNKKMELEHKLELVSKYNLEIANTDADIKSAQKNITKNKERLSEIKIKYQKVLRSSKKLEDIYMSYSYWVDGFKQIRLMLLEHAIKALQIQSNSHLISMGLTNWEFLFSLSEGSDGMYSLQVDVTSPQDKKPVPWESWSGGEQQRLKLAVVFAFVDVLSGYRNLSSNIEVWDEPSAGLSEEGISDLVDILSDRSKSSGKQIWLVDHNSLSSSIFDGVLRLTKDEHGKSTIS